MKIVLVGRFGEGDILTGPEKVARNLFTHIAILNPDTYFFTYFFKLGKRRKVEQILFGSETISNNSNISRFGIFKLVAEIFKIKPDLVHIVTFERFELLILFLRIFLRFKLVYTIHGIYKYERKIFYKKPFFKSDLKDLLLEKLIFAMTDKLVFLSMQTCNLTYNYYNFDKSKVTIIPNGVSVPKFSKEKKLDFSNGIEIVFYNGLEISRERGLKKIIDLISDENLGTIRMAVIGSSVTTEKDNVTFHRPMSDDLLIDFLTKRQVFVDNFDYMPFSILALEAMAFGLILIVSDNSGISSYYQ